MVNMADGGHQVSYDTLRAVHASHVSDTVLVCVAEVETGCPRGSTGYVYWTTNRRAGQYWTRGGDRRRGRRIVLQVTAGACNRRSRPLADPHPNRRGRPLAKARGRRGRRVGCLAATLSAMLASLSDLARTNRTATADLNAAAAEIHASTHSCRVR